MNYPTEGLIEGERRRHRNTPHVEGLLRSSKSRNMRFMKVGSGTCGLKNRMILIWMGFAGFILSCRHQRAIKGFIKKLTLLDLCFRTITLAFRPEGDETGNGDQLQVYYI